MRPVKFIPIVLFCLFFTLSANAEKLEYDKDYIGDVIIHKAIFEDTLVHLARNNNLGFVELRAANPELDPWIPGAGAKIILPKQHLLPHAKRKGIVINLPEMRLYYFEKPGEEPLSYPIGVGREGLNTPTGKTKVTRKKEGPTWRPTARMREEDPTLPAVVEPGPENPLGTHALYLSWPQYAIHGTSKPYGIGRRISSGCIRLYPEGIIDLFDRVPVGTSVQVVDQPVKVGWIDNKMFIEVHPTQDQSISVEKEGVLKAYEIKADDIKKIISAAGEYASQIDWKEVRTAVREHRGYPVQVLNKNRTPGRHVNKELSSLAEEAEIENADIEKEIIEAEKTNIPDGDIADADDTAPMVTRPTFIQYND